MFSSISPLAATTDVSFQKRRALFSWEVSVKFLKTVFSHILIHTKMQRRNKSMFYPPFLFNQYKLLFINLLYQQSSCSHLFFFSFHLSEGAELFIFSHKKRTKSNGSNCRHLKNIEQDFLAMNTEASYQVILQNWWWWCSC